MSATTENNKRIAKNTVMLYGRMLVMLGISLFTSRVILRTLGVVDFGINNVVGGVIAMLGFLTGSLSGATSRFITFDLGAGNIEKLKRTFSSVMFIHYIVAGIILLFGETIGLWFVITQLNIPPERSTAAMVVYQFSILSSILGIISIPYNSDIIAHEKMSAFAYISLMDVTLKLLIVYLLVIIPFDKLITYSFLFFLIQLLDRVIYYVYCKKHFEETRVLLRYDKAQFKEISSYAGWTMTGNLAVVGYTQGINILLNIFFGPAVNAARGIAVQVQNACMQFTNNFQMAFNPQLTKSYAQGDLHRMHSLIVHGSKFSFYILLFIIVPLMIEAPTVLKIWLGIVPEHTVNFLRLILIIGLLSTLSNEILISLHATGKIRKFQIIESSMLLSIVPIAYICLKFFHISPEGVFLVHIIVECITELVRLYIILPMIKMSIKMYFVKVMIPVCFIALISPIIPLIVDSIVTGQTANFFSVCLTCVIYNSIIIYFVGCNKREKEFIQSQFVSVYNKVIRRH
jgi:O-antigen/teichoic acid export membrane protein